MAGGEQRGQRATLENAELDSSVDPDCVHDGADVVRERNTSIDIKRLGGVQIFLVALSASAVCVNFKSSALSA